MSGRRALPAFLATAILLLTSGDCISPLLADHQAKDCCARGKCKPAQKSDRCCQSSDPSATKYFRPEVKAAFSAAAVLVSDAVPAVRLLELPCEFFVRAPLDLTLHSPPTGVKLPLLI